MEDLSKQSKKLSPQKNHKMLLLPAPAQLSKFQSALLSALPINVPAVLLSVLHTSKVHLHLPGLELLFHPQGLLQYLRYLYERDHLYRNLNNL